MGQTKHGVYDAADDADPDLLHHYYGSGSNPGLNSGSPSLPLGSDLEPDSSDDVRSGGDDDPDTDDNSNPDTNGDPADGLEPRWAGSWQDIARVITAAQGRNIRHEAAEVAPSTMPPLDAVEGDVFASALSDALLSEDYPEGFHLCDEYESSESYGTGRSSRLLVIPRQARTVLKDICCDRAILPTSCTISEGLVTAVIPTSFLTSYSEIHAGTLHASPVLVVKIRNVSTAVIKLALSRVGVFPNVASWRLFTVEPTADMRICPKVADPKARQCRTHAWRTLGPSAIGL